MNDTERIIKRLKELIDKNGYDYLTDRPLAVYKELEEADPNEIITAGAILMLLVCGVWDDAKDIEDKEELSGKIQKKCGFNKKMSDKLADVIHTLYSEDNKAGWKNKRDEGLVQFLKNNQTFKWEGFSVWEVGNGSVDCFYNAEIELHPTKMAGQNKDLQKLLKKNPFMTKESIHEFYEKKLKEYLDSEFEEYCTCDDYYEPVVEDFELTYDVEHWCKENGFEVISCEGDGSDGGYEPKFRRGW